MTTTTVDASAPQADIDAATFEVYQQHEGNVSATARELGIAKGTVRSRVERHQARAEAEQAEPWTEDAIAAMIVDVQAEAQADEGQDERPVDADDPADASDPVDAPAGEAPAKRAVATHCALCGFRFSHARSRAICRSADACARRQARNVEATGDAATPSAEVAAARDARFGGPVAKRTAAQAPAQPPAPATPALLVATSRRGRVIARTDG